jgi:surface antigen
VFHCGSSISSGVQFVRVRSISPAHRSGEAPAYHGSGATRRPIGAAALLLAAALGAGSGGCSMSMQLDSLFADKDDTQLADKGDAGDITGSIPLRPSRVNMSSGNMSQTDWTFATVALREALAKGDEGASIPWHNPASGSRGTVTPVASAYVQDGSTCRNFLASTVGSGREGWFEGTACRVPRGEWDVRTARPLQKS